MYVWGGNKLILKFKCKFREPRIERIILSRRWRDEEERERKDMEEK